MSTEEHEGGISRAMYRGVGRKQISAAQYSLLIHRHTCSPQWMLNNITAKVGLKRWRATEQW